ncbi:MAG: hypothetical protein EPN97_04345 [Alphaproteobacteria bacterium]|nr:MAG: hypothetical protein EPN97_04345 [Alphaproteobacteria bacterium]
MSHEKDLNHFLTPAFNNVHSEKPVFVPAPAASVFGNNKLPWEPDRVVNVRLTNGLLAQMIEKGLNPYAGTKTPPPANIFENNRLDNPVPPRLRK